MERAEQRAEAFFHFVGGVARKLKRFNHNVGAVISNRAGRKLDAVADDVVLIRLNRQRVLVFERVHFALRHGERVVGEVKLALFVLFIHREIGDKAHLEAVFVDKIHAFAERRANLPR